MNYEVRSSGGACSQLGDIRYFIEIRNIRQQSSIQNAYDCELSGHKNKCPGLLARECMTQFADGVIYTAFRRQRSPCLAIL